jgi:sulfur carrier protein
MPYSYLLSHSLNVIAISLNGKAQQFDSPISVTALIEHMQLGNKRIAIECNGEIVPRGQFNQHMLHDGDKLEIVVAVGGG